MKKILVTLAAFGLGTSAMLGAAMAQDAMAPAAMPTFATADTDANASVSFSEAQVALPNLTQEQYDAADTNKDSMLDQTEFDALVASSAPIQPTPSDDGKPNGENQDTTQPPAAPAQ